MAEEIYYKNNVDLTAKELMVIYDKHPNREYPLPIPRFDKTGVVLNLLAIQPDFLDDRDKKYYFRKNNDILEYDPNFVGEAAQKTARSDHRIDIEKINELVTMDQFASIMKKIDEDSKIDIKPEPQNSQEQKPRTSTGNQTENQPSGNAKQKAQNSAKNSHGTSPKFDPINTSGKFKMKTPKFDSQLPVENWINAMELFKACSIISEEELIKVALSQLLTEESGTSLIEAITPEELKNWNAFKTKLSEVLGKDSEYYKHLYNSFQRGGETQAMALTKLQAYFKKGYGKQKLDAADESIICERFITAQEPRLMELLKREKSLLNLRNIAQRATELERSFFKRENIFAADDQPKVQSSELSQLCSKLKELVTTASNAQEKKQKVTKRRLSKETMKKLDGHCITYTKKQKCRFGSKCKYIHSDKVPQEIKDALKNEA